MEAAKLAQQGIVLKEHSSIEVRMHYEPPTTEEPQVVTLSRTNAKKVTFTVEGDTLLIKVEIRR